MRPAGIDRPARILVVDDDRRDRDLLEVMLTSDGHHVVSTAGAEGALALVRRAPPDLILLDVLMPGIDGNQLVATLKADPATRNIPVIMLTALDDRSARLEGLSSGAEDFLSKPVDQDELRMRVRNLLRLRSAYAELELRSRELGAALEVARDAGRAAEEADREKTLFLRVMSHELRTPLNAISGYAEVLELGVHGSMNPDQTHHVSRIKGAAAYLTRLINDVLTTEKLGVARPLHLAACAVAPILAEVEGLCALQARASGLTLTVTASRDDVFVLADAERLQQILLNLVMNAVKYTESGGNVNVTCSVDSKMVRIRVSDTGVGIAAADVERVFDPFVQIDRRLTQEPQPGVGLGLSISRQLARAMRGDLTVVSTEGAGSVFTLIVPVAGGSQMHLRPASREERIPAAH